MAGILDPKTRFVDFIFTEEGKRQASQSELNIAFASFTDRHTYYELSGTNEPDVAEDASGRIYFEASSRFQDRIVVETDNRGQIVRFRSKDFDVDEDTVITGSYTRSANLNDASASTIVLTGSSVSQNADNIVASIADNFSDLRIISSQDNFSNRKGFELSHDDYVFSITDDRPFNYLDASGEPNSALTSDRANIDTIEKIYEDQKFKHLPNYTFLPPVNSPARGTNVRASMGDYLSFNQEPILSLNSLEERLSNKEVVEITFPRTSRDNNLIAQVFEFNERTMKKLAIVDFGEFQDEDPLSPGKRVFFLGKFVNEPNKGIATFINIFTVVFD